MKSGKIEREREKKYGKTHHESHGMTTLPWQGFVVVA